MKLEEFMGTQGRIYQGISLRHNVCLEYDNSRN